MWLDMIIKVIVALVIFSVLNVTLLILIKSFNKKIDVLENNDLPPLRSKIKELELSKSYKHKEEEPKMKICKSCGAAIPLAAETCEYCHTKCPELTITDYDNTKDQMRSIINKLFK